jgi:hypothetical protein
MDLQRHIPLAVDESGKIARHARRPAQRLCGGTPTPTLPRKRERERSSVSSPDRDAAADGAVEHLRGLLDAFGG